MARLHAANPYLLSSDLGSAASYYRDALGFEDQSRFGSLLLATRGYVTIMLREAGCPAIAVSNRRRTGNSLDIDAYIWVDDVDSLHAELAQRGARLLTDVYSTAHGTRELEVEDADGHVLCFAQDTTGSGAAVTAALS
jgi:uncharacterized glyoxalase superfamily protein PhnB